MTVKDRLIEILQIPIFITDGVSTFGERRLSAYDVKTLADRLIANGVTFKNNKMFVAKGQRGLGKTYILNKIVKEAKNAAVKEFAERLKEKAEKHDCTYYMSGYRITAVDVNDIDNLVKEMVGDIDGK